MILTLLYVYINSDDINFIVPPIWPYILKRQFNALLETGLHFVNIAGERGLNLPFVDTHFGGIFDFSSDQDQIHISSYFKLIPMILTL